MTPRVSAFEKGGQPFVDPIFVLLPLQPSAQLLSSNFYLPRPRRFHLPRASPVFSEPFVHLVANECPRPSTLDPRLPLPPSAKLPSSIFDGRNPSLCPSSAPQALPSAPSHFLTFYFSPAPSASRLAIHALGCNFASCLFPLRSIRRRMVDGSLRSP